MKHVIFSSMGKDSMASIILAHMHKEPVDMVVYCEVMFDDRTSGEVPEHADFVHNVAIPKIEREFGFPVKVIRANETYVSLFMQTVSKGRCKGMLRGSPLCMGCWVLRDLKLKPIHAFKQEIQEPIVSYIGLAKDEENRIARMSCGQESLLNKYGFSELDAKQLDKKHGLLSPVYEFAPRNGCFFCPNAKIDEFRHLRKYHRHLWDRMLELERTPNTPKKPYNRTLRLADMERDFYIEDHQVSFEELFLEERE